MALDLKDFTLTEARDRARKERQRLHDKDDPLAARRAERAAKAAAAQACRIAPTDRREYSTPM